MAKQRAFTDPYGTRHQKTYWVITELVLKPIAKKALIVVSGWKNKAARDRLDALVGDRQYRLKGDLYTAYFDNDIVVQEGPMKRAYKAVTEIRDVGRPPAPLPGGGMEDDTRTSFFEGATDV